MYVVPDQAPLQERDDNILMTFDPKLDNEQVNRKLEELFKAEDLASGPMHNAASPPIFRDKNGNLAVNFKSFLQVAEVVSD